MLRVQRRHHYPGAWRSEHPSDCRTESHSIDTGLRSIHAPGSAFHATNSGTCSER